MLNAEAASRLCSRLMDYDSSGELMFRSVDVLWNLLENADREEVASQLNNKTCIRYKYDNIYVVNPYYLMVSKKCSFCFECQLVFAVNYL